MRTKQLVWGMALILIIAFMMLSLASFDTSNLITGMITSGERDMTGLDTVYSVAPITKVETGYGLWEYESIIRDARTLVSRCRISEDKQACISGSLRPGWALIGNEEPYYMFEVISSQEIRQYDPDEEKMVEKKIIYRFALDFS